MEKLKLRKFTLPRTDQIPLLGIRNWERSQFRIEKFYFYFVLEKDQEAVSRSSPQGKDFFFLIE